VDHLWINEKGNVEEEEDNFSHSIVKEEEKGRLT
jgi:hypothetical protein